MFRFLKNTAKLACLAPVFLLKNYKTEEEQQPDQDNQQLETSVHNIFLTSEQSWYSELKIFSFDAQSLGKEIASHLDTSLGKRVCTTFKDGQVCIQVLEPIGGHQVFILKSFDGKQINDGLIQLLLAVSCLKKSGAEYITAIIPYMPYGVGSQKNIIQGKDFYTPFMADIIKMLEESGCDRIITLNPSIMRPKGFANKASLLSFNAAEIAVPYFVHKDINDPVIIASKSNTLHVNTIHQLGKTFQFFDQNFGFGVFDGSNYIGENVKGRDVILYLNLLRTGNSLKKQVDELKKLGAKNIYCYGFHNLCPNERLDQLMASLPIEEFITTNTIYSEDNKKIVTISVAKCLAEIISLLSQDKSLSDFRNEREMLSYAYLKKKKAMNQERKLQKKIGGKAEEV